MKMKDYAHLTNKEGWRREENSVLLQRHGLHTVGSALAAFFTA